jgi:hypothetical protein
LDEVTGIFEKNSKFFTSYEYGYLCLANIAYLFTIIGDKGHMLEFLKLTKRYHPDLDNFNQWKDEDDFKAYWGDSDFLKLFK